MWFGISRRWGVCRWKKAFYAGVIRFIPPFYTQLPRWAFLSITLDPFPFFTMDLGTSSNMPELSYLSFCFSFGNEEESSATAPSLWLSSDIGDDLVVNVYYPRQSS
jgi:hypothetical protein